MICADARKGEDMSNFIVPPEPGFNVDNVPKIKESDYITAGFVNDYYQIFLNNMRALKNMTDKKVGEEDVENLKKSINEAKTEIANHTKVIVSKEEIPVSQREKGALYFFVDDGTSSSSHSAAGIGYDILL